MGDVFILGAGFSKAVSADMPLLIDLSRELETRIASLRTVSSVFPDNVEMWLTYLSQDHPWLSEADNLRNRALFLDLSRTIQEVLVERIDVTVKRDCPSWFLDLARWWHTKKATVLTLNYDTLVERCIPQIVTNDGHSRLHSWDVYPVHLTQAMQRGGTSYHYGGAVDTLRLIKLHGSINWFYSGKNPSHGETLYFLPHANAWNEENVSWGKFVRDKIPFIVPPLTDKLPFFQHETLRSLWSQAAEALRTAKRVFCCGYSLPVTDITMRFFLSGNSPSNPVKFYICDIRNEIADHFRLLLPRSYDIDTSFIGPDSVSRLAQRLANGDLDALTA